MANETNVPVPPPNTLEGWVKLLDGVRLPVPQASHDRVCRALRDNRSSLRDIAEMIQDSPALALSVIREANRHAHGHLTTPAENLEVALNRLGFKRTEALLERLPAEPLSQIPVALRQLQLISQHAAQQANGVFRQPPGPAVAGHPLGQPAVSLAIVADGCAHWSTTAG
jgi:hypothetical protein